MSRGGGHVDAMNKISYIFFLTYHSFLFYISKLLDVTVILYFLYSFSFKPRRRFVFQTEISDKYIVLVLISRLFNCPAFLSSPWESGSVYRFLYSTFTVPLYFPDEFKSHFRIASESFTRVVVLTFHVALYFRTTH